jgi:hypothetical protein
MKASPKLYVVSALIISLVLSIYCIAEEDPGDAEPEVYQVNRIYQTEDCNGPEFFPTPLDGNDIEPECF